MWILEGQEVAGRYSKLDDDQLVQLSNAFNEDTIKQIQTLLCPPENSTGLNILEKKLER